MLVMAKPATKKRETIRSQLPVNLTLRGANYELSVQASASKLMHDLDDIKRLAGKAARTLSGPMGASVPDLGPGVSFEEAPSIKAAKSTRDNIQALFETDWGRKSRTVADVVKALEANAVPDTTTSTSVYLNRLVKKGILRRIRKGGRYEYYLLPSS
jgi:hypothetical protein